MGKSNEIDLSQYVKNQTFYTVVIFALFVGFIGGTVYSSFKLGSGGTRQTIASAGGGGQPAASNDSSVQFAAHIMQLEQHLKANPEDAASWAKLGNLFFDSNQPANAIEAYEKSLALEPGNLGVLTDLGVMYRRNDRPEKAVDTFDKVIAIDPSFEQARFNKGIVLLHDLNDFNAGIKAWEELLEVNPMAVTSSGETVEALIKRMKEQQ